MCSFCYALRACLGAWPRSPAALLGCNSRGLARSAARAAGAKNPQAPSPEETKLGFIFPRHGSVRREDGEFGGDFGGGGWLAWEEGKLHACSPYQRNPLPL